MHVFHQGGGYKKFNFRDFRYSDLYGNEYIFLMLKKSFALIFSIIIWLTVKLGNGKGNSNEKRQTNFVTKWILKNFLFISYSMFCSKI